MKICYGNVLFSMRVCIITYSNTLYHAQFYKPDFTKSVDYHIYKTQYFAFLLNFSHIIPSFSYYGKKP